MAEDLERRQTVRDAWALDMAQRVGVIDGRLGALETAVKSNHAEIRAEIAESVARGDRRAEKINAALASLSKALGHVEGDQAKAAARQQGFLAGGRAVIALIGAGVGGAAAAAIEFAKHLFGAGS